jgi:kynurenine formamidase
MTEVVLDRAGRRYVADLSDPLSIAIPVDFDGVQPNHFGAARAHSAAVVDGRWIGEVLAGGTVNCCTLSITPHCNGTHTECVGHITEDRVAIHDVLRGGLHTARLITVSPERCGDTAENHDPLADPQEWIITSTAISRALERYPGDSDALILRTLPNGLEKLTHRYEGAAPAAYLSQQAAETLVNEGIIHLVTDLPSLDRSHDEGRLIAHRVFWGLDAPSRRSRDARRGNATVTELAWIAPTIRDGWYLLDLQLPAFMSDAAPSRPLLYPLRAHV